MLTPLSPQAPRPLVYIPSQLPQHAQHRYQPCPVHGPHFHYHPQQQTQQQPILHSPTQQQQTQPQQAALPALVARSDCKPGVRRELFPEEIKNERETENEREKEKEKENEEECNVKKRKREDKDEGHRPKVLKLWANFVAKAKEAHEKEMEKEKNVEGGERKKQQTEVKRAKLIR